MKKIALILLSIVIISSCHKEQLLEDSNISDLYIYPNPSTGIFNVSFKLTEQNYSQTADINIINRFGEIFDSKSVEIIPPPPSGDSSIVNVLEVGATEYVRFDLVNNPKGIYYVEIATKDGYLRKELILLTPIQ